MSKHKTSTSEYVCYDVGIDITFDVDADIGIDVEPYDMCTNITTSMRMLVPTLLTTWYVMVYDIEETYDIEGFDVVAGVVSTS